MVNQRKKGIRFELECRKHYINVGYKDCQTSRFESKSMDDRQVDLVNTGNFLPQCKNYKANFSISNAIQILKQIKKQFKNKIPVLHIKLTKHRKAVVVLLQEDFFNLLKLLNEKN